MNDLILTSEFSHFIRIFLATLRYIPTTLLISLVSMFFGLIIGTLIAVIRVCRIPGANGMCKLFVSFIRGTPTLVQILLVYFGFPIVMNLVFKINISGIPAIYYAFIAFSFHTGGYLSEVVRGALLDIDSGQQDAARAIGMTRRQMITRILLPQAYRASVPVMANNFISLLKSTSLAYSISVLDITGGAFVTASPDLRFIQAYIAALIIYILLCAGFEQLFEAYERIMIRSRGQGGI